MKRVILTVVLTMIVATASFRAQVWHLVHPRKTTGKEINIYINAPDAYKARAYAGTEAKLNISIVKIKRKKSEVLWQNEYPGVQLNELAALPDSLHQMIRINNLLDRRERVLVQYTVTYQTDSSVMEVQQNKFLGKGTASEDVCINL